MQAAGGNVTKTPADSPARWFKWGPLESGTVSRPPNDDPWRPVGSGDQKYSGPQKSWRWVKDTNANAAYEWPGYKSKRAAAPPRSQR